MSDAGRLFHALGDPTRRDMVERLTDRAMSVSALAAPYDMTLTAIGQHLQILQDCGLVRTEKTGRVRVCSLAPDGLKPLDAWIRARRSPLEQRLDALGDILGEADD